MWFNLLGMAAKTGLHIYKNKQRQKMLMSDAASLHAERMAKGEIEFKQQILSAQDKGWKDEFVLILVSSQIMLLIWSVFSDDPKIIEKVNRFFELFGSMPMWYQILFISVVASVYGLKGANIMKKK